jgi:hypothetical protein
MSGFGRVAGRTAGQNCTGCHQNREGGRTHAPELTPAYGCEKRFRCCLKARAVKTDHGVFLQEILYTFKTMVTPPPAYLRTLFVIEIVLCVVAFAQRELALGACLAVGSVGLLWVLRRPDE